MSRNLTLLATGLIAMTAASGAQEAQLRVLNVLSNNPNAPGVVAFNENLHGRFLEDETPAVEFFNELLDYDRFPDRGRWPEIARSIADKYRDLPPAVIVAQGSAALLFASDHLRQYFPTIPIVYGLAFDQIVDYSALPANVTGRRHIPGFAETLALAKRLQPDAERVVLVGGSSANDSALFDFAVREIRPHLDNMTLVPLRDWTYPTLLQTLRKLPRRSIVILSSFRSDQRGYVFSSGDLIGSITTVSAAPVYGVARNWVNDGVVGGAVLDFGADGAETARLLETVLKRRDGDALPAPEIASNPSVVDWRQLQRWGLSESSLPPGTEVLFRVPTPWERHRVLILSMLAVLIAQLTLIAMLLLERSRRRTAQQDAETTRGQVTHIARVATAGQITAAVTHELRQPLTAIHASAQAGALMLHDPQPNLAELRDILDSIVTADERAVELIDHIRELLRTETPKRTLIDLNAVCTRSVQLMQSEATARGVRLESAVLPKLSPVYGDAVQLEQVFINLMLNAFDAAAATSNGNGNGNGNGNRTVYFGTREGITEVEVFVRNNGSQLSPEVKAHLFDAFFSTKSKGLGMGLAIVRMIVERHRGVVLGANTADGGVVFRVVLPKA